MKVHWFWWLLSLGCVLWYCTVTLFVAIRGVRDIREMLRRLRGMTGIGADSNLPKEENQ